jgi:hypothetical protein
MIVWDNAYNASPGSSLSKALIDDEIRRVKSAIRERMEVEHDWSGDGGGEHIPGGTTVMDKGDSTAMSAVSNPQLGALFLLEDGSDLQINYYYDGVWNQLSTLDHLALSGTADNDHSDLLLRDGGILSGDLDMGNYKLSTTGTVSTFGDFLIYGHKSGYHPTIGSVSAIKDDSIGQAELKIVQAETTQVIAAGGELHIDKLTGFNFVPQVYAKTAFNSGIYLFPSSGSSWGWSIKNNTGSPVEVRIRQEAIAP